MTWTMTAINMLNNLALKSVLSKLILKGFFFGGIPVGIASITKGYVIGCLA